MMKKLAIIITATILSISISAQDPHWNTDGNTGTNPNDDFVGTTDDVDLRFRTDDEERMALTSDEGWLGLGTNNPSQKFHIYEAEDPASVFLQISKATNPVGLRIGLTNEGTGTPGRGYIRLYDDEPLLLFGHNAESMRLTREYYSGTIPENTGQVNRVLLRYNMGAYLNEPYSMLTMGRNWPDAETDGLERDWMNVGTTCLFNADILYTGLIEYEDAVTDAVTVWGCQEGGEAGPDNYRFLFIKGTAGTGDAAEEEGRETMRITPMGNVGIGDFSSMPNGLDEQPTHKLDVNGTARLRQMPNETPNVLITGVEEEETGDYELNYMEFSGNSNDILAGDGTWIAGSGVLCDWEVVGGGVDVATGYSTACRTGQVLVGTDTQSGSNAKVFMTKDYDGTTRQVEATSGSGIGQTAGNFIAENAGGFAAVGVTGSARNAGLNVGLQGIAERGVGNFGVSGSAENAQLVNYGVYGHATLTQRVNYGVYGEAESTEEPEPMNNVGVFGEGFGPATANNFGGYFLACGGSKDAIAVYGEVFDTTSGVAGYFAGSVQVS